MTPIVRGKYVLQAISKLKEPAHLDDIVNYLAPNFKESKVKLTKVVKTTLDAGVRYGFLDRYKNKYYSEKSKSSNKYASDEEFDGITSGGSMESMANDKEFNSIRSNDSMADEPARPIKKIVKGRTASRPRDIIQTIKKNQLNHSTKTPANKNKQAAVFSGTYDCMSDDDEYVEDRGSRRRSRSHRSRSSKRARSFARSRSSRQRRR